tara:strand:- start:183 stop:335 length:153 start_codon:yes stop_codon:yes gene_type:complete
MALQLLDLAGLVRVCVLNTDHAEAQIIGIHIEHLSRRPIVAPGYPVNQQH